jgi:3-oxoadipate enol-lactonase
MSYARTRLGRWYYEERGAARRAGDPGIVLLHGLLFDGGMYKAQVEPLSAIGRVVAFDGPGHGKSEVPPPFTLEDHVEALQDALDEVKIGRAVLVGLSWGGMVAMRAAIAHPARIAGLVLLNTSADPEERARAVKYRLLTSFGKRFGIPRALVDAQLAEVMFGPSFLRERPEILDEFVRRVNGYPRLGVARASLAVAVERTGIQGKLARIRAPTLVVCGREDRATEPEHGQAIARSIPGAKLVMIEDCGHPSVIERPDAVNAELVPFVRSLFP